VSDCRPHELREPAELPVQSRRLELFPNWPHLSDVNPADPEVVLEEPLEEDEVQVEGLRRLTCETRHEVEPGQEPRQPVLAPLSPDRGQHANRLEASVRLDVEA